MYIQLLEDLSSPTISETPRPTTCITLCTQCPSRHISNIDSIYESYKPTIQSAVQLLNMESEFKNLSPPENPKSKRSILPFLGDALKSMCKPTDTGTDQTTGDSSPCYSYPKYHKIHCPCK